MGVYLDTSAVLAILLSEPDADDYLERIGQAQHRVTSVATMFEMILALGSKTGDRENAPRHVRQFLRAADAEIVPLTADMHDHFVEASYAYHRGAGHRAKLNYGDCITYAAAKTLGLRLLYKGKDFAHTDLA